MVYSRALTSCQAGLLKKEISGFESWSATYITLQQLQFAETQLNNGLQGKSCGCCPLVAAECIVLAAVLAVANAGYLGGPAISYGAPALSYAAPALSYAAPALSYAAPVAVHAPSVGSYHESTVRSLDGNSAVTHYSKAVDSAFSSVRKVDTRVSNDAQALAYAPVATAYHACSEQGSRPTARARCVRPAAELKTLWI
uniref:Uncharacterized protein n=1 Tax=Timema shepardi TaxID=629360 RepID=A0A7R9FVN7_TIMSH|nr:unnamed protein product [Timema shepardi]